MERASVGLEAYRGLARPLIGAPGWRERDPPGVYTECDVICEALASIGEDLEDGVCIAGPGVDGYDGILEECPVLAGPSAAVLTGAMAGHGLLYVTSDLDSRPLLEHLSASTARFLLVHVHSDNHYRLNLLGGRRLIYTGQECAPRLLPAGGFTDGDRAIVLAMALGAPWVRVLGFTGRPETWHKEYPFYKGWKLVVARGVVEYVARGLGYFVRSLSGGMVLERG